MWNLRKSKKKSRKYAVKALVRFIRDYKAGKRDMPICLSIIKFLEEVRELTQVKLALKFDEQIKLQQEYDKQNMNTSSALEIIEQMQKKTNLIMPSKIIKISEIVEKLKKRQSFRDNSFDIQDQSNVRFNQRLLPDLNIIIEASRWNSKDNHALNFVLNSHYPKKEKEVKKRMENIEEINDEADMRPEPPNFLQKRKLTTRHKNSFFEK